MFTSVEADRLSGDSAKHIVGQFRTDKNSAHDMPLYFFELLHGTYIEPTGTNVDPTGDAFTFAMVQNGIRVSQAVIYMDSDYPNPGDHRMLRSIANA